MSAVEAKKHFTESAEKSKLVFDHSKDPEIRGLALAIAELSEGMLELTKVLQRLGIDAKRR
jgi:hypothetical protein